MVGKRGSSFLRRQPSIVFCYLWTFALLYESWIHWDLSRHDGTRGCTSSVEADRVSPCPLISPF